MTKRNRRNIQSKAPKREELSVQTYDPFHDDQETYPGDSADEHKRLESVNKTIGADEIKQQNENL
ncbi:hypothetical protein GWK91_05875 [Virgibacillus sp. MSP4-1]|uniref:hypothetical protein n=1 Tax=Virgibacillus sp. MSP4-1 TaxID=2700081 RepID=UPI00039B1238|nr:hypothetical protein [Virgibacillus sp. MSP4-1]QHS22507.1 hypothetical protein GWK91_05875 [Virgibacillus sp. MSP4-1]